MQLRQQLAGLLSSSEFRRFHSTYPEICRWYARKVKLREILKHHGRLNFQNFIGSQHGPQTGDQPISSELDRCTSRLQQA